jgi:hypothetical protein
MLDRIGLTDSDLRLYGWIIRQPKAEMADLIEASRLPAEDVRSICSRLCEAGLVVINDEDVIQGNPAGPDVALERLNASVEDEYSAQRRELADLHQELSRIVSEGMLVSSSRYGSPVEVLPNSGAARMHLLNLIGHARHELLWMWNGHSAAAGDDAVLPTTEFKAHRRGVELRVILPSSTLVAVPRSVRDHVDDAALRLVSSTPTGLHVFDRRVAVVSPDNEDGDVSFLVHGAPLVSLLRAFFETWWERGIEADVNAQVRPGVEPAARPQGEDLVLLQYLGDGLKDENMARQLGVSVRTVRRRISVLLTRLGASSRFQAGVLATRRNWI